MIRQISATMCLLTILSITLFAQKNETHIIEVDAINISSDRTRVFNNQGTVSLFGKDENGGKLFKDGTNGMFGLSGAEMCSPCNKGTIFPARNQDINWNWITAGGTQTPQERTYLTGTISHPSYQIPIYQVPRNRALQRFVPFTFTGEVLIRDCQSGTSCVDYIDENVNFEGFMRVEFKQTFSRSEFIWRNYQIVANE